ncbi:unnamed protein product [Sphagnum balticum]
MLLPTGLGPDLREGINPSADYGMHLDFRSLEFYAHLFGDLNLRTPPRLLLKEEEVRAEVREERRGQFKLQETGWTITVKDGTVYKTGETRCVFYTTGHIKVTNSKAKGVSDIVKILRDKGVLAM